MQTDINYDDFVNDLSISKGQVERYVEALITAVATTLKLTVQERVKTTNPFSDRRRPYVWARHRYSARLQESIKNYDGMSQLLDDSAALQSGLVVINGQKWGLLLDLQTPDKARLLDLKREDAGSDRIQQALALIDHYWPEAGAEARAIVSAVAWTEGSRTLQASDPKSFGVIYLNHRHYSSCPIFELATALVHECGHHSLFVGSVRAPVFITRFNEPLFSPIRNQVRPAIAVLHGGMALARMCSWAAKLEGTSDERAIEERRRVYQEYGPKLRETLSILSTITLTSYGQEIISSFAKCLIYLPTLPQQVTHL